MFRKITKFFTKNWIVKIVCICIASILWFYVVSSQNTIAKFPGELTIKAINTPSDLVAIYDAKTVEIKVMAEPSVWQKLSAETFSASVDLSGMTEGTHEVPVNVTTSISGVQIVQKTPDKILVTLEPLVTKEVPISKKIEGNAADGMVVGSVNFSANKAVIHGAKSLIEGITEVSAVITLNGESVNFSRSVHLAVFDDKNDEIKSIEISPSEVQADVAVVKGSNIKTVGIKANIVGLPKNNYFISNISVAPGVVDITGVRDTVNATKYIETLPIDVSGITADLTKDTTIVLPDGISILSGNTTKVHITISISTNTTSKEIIVTNLTAINHNFSSVTFDPASVKVVCEGNPTAISNLTSNDLSISIDLNGKQPDQNGVITVALLPSNVHLPSDINVISLTPQTLQIRVK